MRADPVVHGRHLLRVEDLAPGETIGLATAAVDELRQPSRTGELDGGAVVVLTDARSLSTTVRMQAAISRLGGSAIRLGPTDVAVDDERSRAQAAESLATTACALAVQWNDHDALVDLVRTLPIPVVNLGSDRHRPWDALADLAVLLEHFGTLDGLRVAVLGADDGHLGSFTSAARDTGIDLVRIARGQTMRAGIAGADAVVVADAALGHGGAEGDWVVGSGHLLSILDAVADHAVVIHGATPAPFGIELGERSLGALRAAAMIPTAVVLLRAATSQSDEGYVDLPAEEQRAAPDAESHWFG